MLKEMKTLKDKVDHYMQFTFEQLCDAVEELDCAISDVMENTNSFDEFMEKSISLREDIDAATIAKRNGGGGHLGAAAFESFDSIENTKNLVYSEFINELKIKKLNFRKNPFKH